MKKKPAKTDIVTVTKTQEMFGRPETLALLSDIRSLIDYSRTNLFHMIRFTEVFSDLKIVQTLSGQLGWSHFVLIIAFDEFRLKLIANKLRRVAV